MAEYYYLIASLPYIVLGEKPILTYEKFIEDCSMWLSELEFSELIKARIDIESIDFYEIRNALLKRWYIFEHSIRNELARLRANGRGLPSDKYVRNIGEEDPSVFSVAREAMKDVSPYNAEKKLIEYRWSFLENLEVELNFAFEKLLIYSLKLQLVNRWLSFNVEAGQRVFHLIYEGNKNEEERKYRENSRN